MTTDSLKPILASALMFTALNAVAQAEWTMTRLPDTGEAVANAINNVGQVVGMSRTPGSNLGAAVLWQGGRLSFLDADHLSTASTASDINDAGQVVGTRLGGYVSGGFADRRATLWQGGQTFLLPLTVLGGPSGASAINASGTVVGWSWGGNTLPTIWRDAGATTLDLPAGAVAAELRGIDNHGRLLMASSEPPSVWWGTEGSFIDVGHLFPATPWSFPSGLNDAGQIVGESVDKSNETWHAFIWEGGQMRELPMPAGFSETLATGINASGQAVGRALRRDPLTGVEQSHAILWDGDRIVDLTVALGDAAADLNLLPTDINDAGVIVGAAEDAQRHSHAFVLTSVPEPGTAVLLFAGGLLVWRRDRRSRPVSARCLPSA